MFIDIIKVVILSIVEGFTEFIPVSSTGHMIIAEYFLKLSDNSSFVAAFQIIIQLGAILSVVFYFRNKIWPFSKNISESEKKNIIEMWVKIIVAFSPAAVSGFLLDDIIEEYFFNPVTVSIMLILYGVILIFIESSKKKSDGKKFKIENISEISFKTAFGIGLFQCLAMIPGTSRSAATIIGGIMLGLSRVLASEFSFFLAIPTMTGASFLKIVKMGNALSPYEWFLIAFGFAFSFLVSYLVVKIFMNYIKENDFKIFGYYRIVLGVVLLIFFFSGVIN